MAYESVNPYTNEVLKTFPDATDAEIEQTLEASHNAFLDWKDRSIAERGVILQRAADLLRTRANDYAKLLTLEMGKITAEGLAEVEIAAGILEYYVKHTESLLAPEKLAIPASEGEATLVYEPLGIILAIEPWNFPYYQVARILAPQLAAGNTLILKHASNVPQCALAFEQLMLDAGLPAGAFSNVFATRQQIETILNDPRVHGVALTGSEGAGTVVASQAGKALKKSTLELGGADALVVLHDADMKKTADWAVFGRHSNAGQVCIGSKRMIIVDEVYEEFLHLYTEGITHLKAGDPFDPETTLAPLSSQAAADEVREKISQAVSHGAKATEVGAKVPSHGAFVQPTLLTNLTPENPSYYWEFFGPVSIMLRAKDESDAVHIANDSPFGLGGSVFTADAKRGTEIAKRISSGMVFVNHPTSSKPNLPFGGVKRSGYGRELIGLGIKEFINQKLICIRDIDASY
jgi:succinate-semialdehyde dehydrogenase/glutarate-semialdehyde dehydrogenase